MPRFDRSFETQKIVDALRQLQVGELIPYSKLSEAVERPVIGSTPHLRVARDILFRESSMLFSCVSGSGVRRMNDTDLVESSDMRREKARRQAKKGVDALSVVEDFSNLPPDLQLTFKANSVILAELTIKSSELYKKQKIDVAKTDGAKLLEILLEAKKAK